MVLLGSRANEVGVADVGSGVSIMSVLCNIPEAASRECERGPIKLEILFYVLGYVFSSSGC